MSAVQTMLAPPPLGLVKETLVKDAPIKEIQPKETLVKETLFEEFLDDENANQWPADIWEAYARLRGPYTAENAALILEEESVELFNGWLVWQEMTNLIERRTVATIHDMLSLSARNIDFGQMFPDQAECRLSNGDVVKPDASLISWERMSNDIHYSGRRKRPLLNGGPELVIEVRSPSNRRGQEKSKRQLYFENKVQVIWDVDPVKEQIWVYRVEDPDHPACYSKNDFIECKPFLPNWRRSVADIFAAQASAKTVAGEVADAWRAEGKNEGFAEGENAGVVKTLRELLPMFAQAQFRTTLPADLLARLALCDLARLQSLQTAIPTAKNLAAWLELLPPSP